MKLYINITTSVYLALIICILFISLMQSVNGAQLLIIIIVQPPPLLPTPPPPPLHEKEWFDFSKIKRNEGGGLKIFARKGVVRQNGGFV